MATVPETLAPATAFAVAAVVARATVPLTLAPVKLVNADPLPTKYPAVILPVVEIVLLPKLDNNEVTLLLL